MGGGKGAGGAAVGEVWEWDRSSRRSHRLCTNPTGPHAPVKPRFLLSPWRTLSPSSSTVMRPRAARACSRVHATVLLPLPLRPASGGETWRGAQSDAGDWGRTLGCMRGK
jgi:hypothetical protein